MTHHKSGNLTWSVAPLLVAFALLVGACSGSAPAESTLSADTGDTTSDETSTTEALSDGSAAGEPVDLRFTLWIPSDAPHMEVFNLIKDEYEAANPNVSIEYDFIPFGDYESTITLQLAGTNPPDAGWLVERSAPTFTGAGVLVDLSQAVRSDPDYRYDDFAESALGLWVDGDAVYGIPFSTSPFLILYNRSLFTEAGVSTPEELIAAGEWNWQRVAEVVDEIQDETGSFGFLSSDGKLFTGDPWPTIYAFMAAYGGTPWDEADQCGFSSAGSIEGLSLLHDMIFTDKSAVPPGTEIDFFAGGAAVTIGQLSRVNRLADATFEWGIAPLPGGPSGEVAIIGQAAITAFAKAPHPEVAADFVRFLTTEENVTRLSAFFPPARESVMSSDAFYNANPLLDAERIETVVAPAMTAGTVLPSHEQFAAIDITTQPLLDGLWTKDGDAAATGAAICEAIQPLLDK